MQANSGTDPYGSYREFMKKDVQKPIRTSALPQYQNNNQDHFKSLQNTWAVGTTKYTKTKVQPDGTMTRDFKPVHKHNIKTDHISVEPPASERPFQKIYDQMLTKPAYDKNQVSTKPWVPNASVEQTVNNRSSVSHNIINHQDNTHSGLLNVGVMDKTVCNRKKGIGECSDLMHIYANKSNPDFVKAFNADPNQFKRKTGVFSHLYDAAHRFGEDKPFKV